MGDLVPVDYLPDAVRIRVIGGAIVHEQGTAKHQRAADRPWPHHPTNVRIPEHDVARLEVEAMGHVLGARDRETAMNVLGAFGLPGRPGRVNNHVKSFGRGLNGIAPLALAGDQVVPPDITLRVPWDLKAQSPSNNDF